MKDRQLQPSASFEIYMCDKYEQEMSKELWDNYPFSNLHHGLFGKAKNKILRYILRMEEKTLYVGKGDEGGTCFKDHGFEALDKTGQGNGNPSCKSAAPLAIRKAWLDNKSEGHYHFSLPEMNLRGALTAESAAIIANISPFLINKSMGDSYVQLNCDEVLTLGHTISQKARYRGAYTPHLCASLYPTQ